MEESCNSQPCSGVSELELVTGLRRKVVLLDVEVDQSILKSCFSFESISAREKGTPARLQPIANKTLKKYKEYCVDSLSKLY